MQNSFYHKVEGSSLCAAGQASVLHVGGISADCLLPHSERHQLMRRTAAAARTRPCAAAAAQAGAAGRV